MTRIERKQAEEFKETHRHVEESHTRVKPTAEEIQNGWDEESLNCYLREQETAQQLRVDPNSLHRRLACRPRAQNHRYNPHRWRS